VKADDATLVPYQGVWRPFSFEHQGEEVTDRVLVVWSDGKQRLDEQKRKTYLKRLLNKLETVQQQLNTRRYKKRSYVEQRLHTVRQGNPAKGLVDIHLRGQDEALTLNFCLNRSKLAEAQALDGRYALATNAPHLNAHQTLRLFKGQDGVEKRFRTVKGPMLVRPLFVRNDQRIEGLVFITLLALLTRAILERICRQHGLEITAQRLFRAFTTLQAVDLVWRDGSTQRRASEMTTFQEQVIETLDWFPPQTYVRLTPLVH
jgi:transposase